MSEQIPVHTIDPKDHMPTVKKRIHPRFVMGFYQKLRVVTMYTVLVVFLFLPFLRYDGRQAVWFDAPTQHFYIFGLTFLPQDLYYLAWMFIMAAFTLFMVTVYGGRIFCGYVCPQTVWTNLYMRVEKFFEGDRNKRFKLDKAPWTFDKIWRRAAVYTVWFLLSFFTGLTFVSYFASTDALYTHWGTFQLLGMSLPYPNGIGATAWTFIGIFTFATFMNAGFMREIMCFQICPYGRFQSVMFDKDTLIVSYDYERGEPRGARKKGTHPEDKGDCVNCDLCVQVCPTGIDIRNGLQMECIQCAACIDACNDIMQKLNYPTGLVRYTTERQLHEHKKAKLLRPRLIAYLTLLTILFGGFIYMLSTRVPVEIDVRRDRNQLAVKRSDGLLENVYTIKITNKTQEEHDYTLTLSSDYPLTLQSNWKTIPLEAGEGFDLPVSVVGNPKEIPSVSVPVTFKVESIDDDTLMAEKANVFTKYGYE